LCHSKNIVIEAVSGKAEILTFTINYQPWMPGLEVPFVLAVVRCLEQDDLRITTHIVGCDPEEEKIGMPVKVIFEAHEDEEVWIPLFTPDESGRP
jgi:uncharacterized OB-fold protein